MRYRFLILIFLPVFLLSCNGQVTESDKAQILAVQAAYDREFATALATHGAVSSRSRFPATLAQIETIRAGMPSPDVTAYLDVLEGMIYLQTDQTGKAALMRADVERAAGVLGGKTGFTPRDALFARSFSAMLSGREAMIALADVSGLSDADQTRRITLAGQLDRAAKALTGTLCTERRAGRLPPGDGGAALVSGFGASFLSTADVAAQQVCGFEPPAIPLCEAYAGRAHLRAARDLRAAFSGGQRQGTQLARLDQEIATRLGRAFRGAPPAPADPCN